MNLRSAVPGSFGERIKGPHHLAIRDLSFSLSRGESIGIIGPNGAGKSTLLKLAAQVSRPTTGRITRKGRLASLIELGVGFHPDLTGRENVRFSAAVLGMGRREVLARQEEIIEFAGVRDFIDTPVKRYSSGMLARLGFSVAAHLDAEIVAVDEVLSVGDAAFQKRAFSRMATLKAEGAALLFVTHNLWIVPEVCQRVLRLEAGALKDQGPPRVVIDRYRASVYERGDVSDVQSSQIVIQQLKAPARASNHEPVEIRLQIDVREAISPGRLVLAIERLDGFLCASSEMVAGPEMLAIPGRHVVHGRFERIPLVPGLYVLRATISEFGEGPVVHEQSAVQIEICGSDREGDTYGVAVLEADWTGHPLTEPGRSNPS